SWVPFQRQIKKSGEVIERTVYQPYMDVKTRVERETAPPSLARDRKPRSQNRTSEHMSCKLDTAGAVHTFVLAMALNPLVQKRAQAEIDGIVRVDQIPAISDMAHLPTYVRALIKETLRCPPVPLSVPCRTAQDDMYSSFFIPKDTIVFPNIWAISRDTTEPKEFNPGRFLGSDAPADPFEYVFGVGRRICTGVYLAENSIFAMISGLLATFNISSIEGETLTPQFSPRNISSPERFKCVITPRSAAKAELIKQRAVEISMAGWA
ncbi:cytochrome P450, partial [Mycena capillaripes]